MRRRGWGLIAGLVVLGVVVSFAVGLGIAHSATPGRGHARVAPPAGVTPGRTAGVTGGASVWALPPATTYSDGVALGYPDTQLGAVAAASALTHELYAAAAQATATSRVLSLTTDSSAHQRAVFASQLEVWATGEGATASSAWTARWLVYGCRAHTKATGAVTVNLEGTVTFPNGAAGAQVVAWPMRFRAGQWMTTAVAEPTPFRPADPPAEGWVSC